MMALAGDGRGDCCGYIELQSRQKLALELFDPSCDYCACSIVTVISLLLRSLCPVILVADDFKVILVADSKVIIVAMSGKMMTVILVSAFVLLLAKGALSGGHCNGMGRRFCADNPTRAQHYAGTCPEPCRERVSLIAPHDTRSIEYTLSESRVEERIVASQTLLIYALLKLNCLVTYAHRRIARIGSHRSFSELGLIGEAPTRNGRRLYLMVRLVSC